MKILIINPPRLNTDYSISRDGRSEVVMKNRIDTPINLLIIASILRELNQEIHFIDANGFNKDYDFITEEILRKSYNCVIFSFNLRFILHDLKICEIVKDINQQIITIGFSWNSRYYAQDILKNYQNLDILIINDPLFIIKKLINCFIKSEDLKKIRGIAYRDKKNGIIINSEINKQFDFNDLPLPAYDILPSFKPYYVISSRMKPYALIYAGKGCPYNCKFCNVAGTKYKGRSPNKIIEELTILKKLGKIKYIWFYDEVFTLNRKRIIEFCNKLLKNKLNIKWFCDTRINLVDEKLLKLMKKSGCKGIAYGIESGSQKILNLMNKGLKISEIIEKLKLTRKAHIPIQMNIIIGYHGETRKTLQETRNLIKMILPQRLQISIVKPFKGTAFYQLIHEREWLSRNNSLTSKTYQVKINSQKYVPFELDLKKEFQEMFKLLYRNPKWWIISTITLLRNYELLLPSLEIFIKKFLLKSIQF